MSLMSLFGSIELGLIYAVLALGVFLSFRTLNTPDLTVDGSIVTGAAVSAVMCSAGFNPVLALFCAFLAGTGAGIITALLNTKLKIQPLLAGILVMLGLYSINMRIMGGKANIALLDSSSIYSFVKEHFPGNYSIIALGILILIVLITLFYLFLKTRIGLVLRATGDNENMVRAYGVNGDTMRVIGLALSNGLVGLCGGMLSQYQSYTDIGMGVGMVVIGLASVIIGEAVFGSTPLIRRLIAVVLGAVLYRLVISFAISWGMEPMDLKLVSAIIVTIALSLGLLGDKLMFIRRGFRKNAKN